MKKHLEEQLFGITDKPLAVAFEGARSLWIVADWGLGSTSRLQYLSVDIIKVIGSLLVNGSPV